MIRAYALVIAFIALALSGCGNDTPEAHVASAQRHMAKNEYPAAVIELKNALQKNPKLAEARLLLGTALIETGDVAGANIELQRALELGTPRRDAIAPLARALVGLAQYQNVIDQFGTEDLGSPERQAELATALGEAYLGLRQPDQAWKSFAAALSLRPSYSPALLGSARVKAAAGYIDGALELARSALAADPKSLPVMEFEAAALVAAGRLDEALAAYRKALKLHPRSVIANFATTAILIEQNKLDEAAKQLAVLRQFAPKRPETLFMQANYEYRRKNSAAARQHIRQYLGSQPDSVRGLLMAAAIEYEAKAYSQAEEYLLRALSRAPSITPTRRMLVVSYMRSGKHREALEALRPLLTVADSDPATLTLAGETYLTSGDARQAEVFFTKAAQLNPADRRTVTGLALSHLAQGRVDEAYRELEQASENDAAGRADMTLFMAAMRQRNYERALAAVDAMEKKLPNQPTPHNFRGVALLAKRDVAGARKSFERALELDAAFFPAALNLARLDIAEKKLDEARKRFERVLARNPKSVPAMLSLADVLYRSGASSEQVTGLIGKAVSASPADPKPRLAMINHFLRAKEPKKAVAAAQDALAAIPNHASLLEAAGRAHHAAGAPQQALDMFRKWSDVQPQSPTPWIRMADMNVAMKDFDGARKSLTRALQVKPDALDAQRRMVSLDLSERRIVQALATARNVQKQRPKGPEGFLLEGDVHAFEKSWGAAVTAYRAALKQGESTDAAVRLHAALHAANNETEAEKFQMDWLVRNPNDLIFRAQVAQTALSSGDAKAAAGYFRQLVEAEPNNPKWLNNLSWSLGRLNDPKAIEYAEKAARLAPDDALILDTYGMLLLQGGDTRRSVEVLRKASALSPKDPTIRLNLAKSLVKAGDKASARHELEQLAKMGETFAGHTEVATLLKSL